MMELSLEEFLETRKCRMCQELVANIYCFVKCDHVLCERCRSNPPDKCPGCGIPHLPDEFYPDLLFLKIHSKLFPDSSKTPQRVNAKRNVTPEAPVPSTSPMCKTSTTPDKNSPQNMMKKNAKGETILHQYCCLGFNKKATFQLENLRSMLSSGANPNTRDAAGMTPMHEAVEAADPDILILLLDHGGRVNCYSENQSCNTPLHVAADRYGHLEPDEHSKEWKILRILLDAGADVLAKDIRGRTPFSLVKNSSMRNALIAYKPDTLNQRIEKYAPTPPTTIRPSNFESFDTALFKRFSRRFNINFLQRDGDMTHIVVNDKKDYQNPTFTLRLGIVSGIYIITKEWLKESLTKDSLQLADNFEISEPILINSRLEYVSRRSRINAQALMPKLFAGGQFHILTTPQQKLSSDEKNNLTKLIQAGGGTILSREPKRTDPSNCDTTLFHAPGGSMFQNCSTFILFKKHPPDIMLSMPHIKHVSVQWLYDCIDSFSIVNF